MLNSIALNGRLTRDPDLRTTGSGKSVTTFTLAVERNYADADGNRKADFINCVIWNKAAETFANYTSKGSLVAVGGRLQTRSYDDKNGNRVFVTEVIVTDFSFLNTRKEREEQQNNNSTAQDPFETSGDVDISSDDLPF